MSAPAISKHVKVLERAGLVEQERQGRVGRCRLLPTPLNDAAAWVERHRRFSEAQLDQLGDYLEKVQAASPRPMSSKTACSKRKEK
jgi:DNA-binding transcriptional ArsR family regulator